MRKTCGGEKWGRLSRACLECERRGGYRTPESVFCLLWGSSRRNVERPGVQSGDEQGAPRGGKWGGDSSELTGTQTSIIREQPGVGSGDEQGAGRGGKWGRGNSMGRMVANSLHSPAGSALTPQGGKWGRSGNAPGWKVGAPRGSALTPGHSAYAPGHSAYAPGHSTRPHVGHNPITMRTAGHDHGYKSDITPAQHAKTRPRPGVTPTIHDTVFDLWTTQAQGRTQ